jgi:hypothetical protein
VLFKLSQLVCHLIQLLLTALVDLFPSFLFSDLMADPFSQLGHLRDRLYSGSGIFVIVLVFALSEVTSIRGTLVYVFERIISAFASGSAMKRCGSWR